jgi:hypothetical protein
MLEQSRDVRVRPADLHADRERILAVLGRNLSAAGTAERFRWLYLSNPHGRARVWVAEDVQSGEVVGSSAGHPKRVWMDGKTVDVLDLSDFAFDRPYRTLGPALKLLRSSLEPIDLGEFAFSYDHPSRAMLALYRRLGGRDLSTRRRWVRLLRLSDSIRRRFGNGAACKLARVGDLALRVRDSLRRPRTGFEVTRLGVGWEDEFDLLDARLARETRFRVCRRSAYVRWRYLSNVMARHEVLCARERGKLVGYLVFRPREGGVLAIVDLVGSGTDALISELVGLGHARRVSALWCTVLRDSPVERELAANGFVVRDEGPGVVVHAPTASEAARQALQTPENWWMLEGDEDV